MPSLSITRQHIARAARRSQWRGGRGVVGRVCVCVWVCGGWGGGGGGGGLGGGGLVGGGVWLLFFVFGLDGGGVGGGGDSEGKTRGGDISRETLISVGD